jgi:hypothetical protein
MSNRSSSGFVTPAALLLVVALVAFSLHLGALLKGLNAAELLIERIETHLEHSND